MGQVLADQWRYQLSRIRPNSSAAESFPVAFLQYGLINLKLKPDRAILLVSIFSLLLPVRSSPLITQKQNAVDNPSGEAEPKHYKQFTDQWALHIVGGADRAHQIASKHGFVNIGEVNLF